MRSFCRFLDDWGNKYRWIFLKFGMKIVYIRFYDTHYVFFKFLKILDFIKVFQKISIFQNFEGQNSKLEISRYPFCRVCHFTSKLVFLCGLLLNSIFGEFLNIEPILVKIGVKSPHKNANFSKIFRLISNKFGYSMSNRCRIKYIKFCVDICIGFVVAADLRFWSCNKSNDVFFTYNLQI